MADFNLTNFAREIFDTGYEIASELRCEFFVPEHFLLALIDHEDVNYHKYSSKINFRSIRQKLIEANDDIPKIEDEELKPDMSYLLKRVMKNARLSVKGRRDTPIPSVAILIAILNESHCVGSQILSQEITDLQEFAEVLLALDSKSLMEYESDDDCFDNIESNDSINSWRKHVIDLHEKYSENSCPIVGRKTEIARISQILCRCEKNNVLVVGEPGVGKTALIRGFVAQKKLNSKKLSDKPVYEISVQALLAGAQYQGEIEQRVNSIMTGIKSSGGAIIVMDDLHTLVGSRGDANGSRDLTQLFIKYLDDEDLRFIGITNHEDINRYMDSCNRFLRRFQMIDIKEPSADETLSILNGVKSRYEKGHGVKYLEGTLQHIVKLCERFLLDRNFPDKAIDVLDEAGAYREMNQIAGRKTQSVNNDLIDLVVAQMGNIENGIVANEDTSALKNLQSNLQKCIFGQTQALEAVAQAVLSARAGLTDNHKPQASLLFVGPTGVGKTEVAKVLSEQLGLPLHKFDMSEYSESYSVSKLIGSSPGYIGYEEGGRLTEAVRKNPHCVLLLDEIEKAHEKIYDTLLQVMDYASLTDSRGRHVDFSHVILIMTSNSGAQFAKQAGVGFGSTVTAGQAMLNDVKKTFKPEFVNRLSDIIVFNDMNREMASLILDKKLEELNNRLGDRSVDLSLTTEAREWLLDNGFSQKYGAREIERVITRNIKPLLVKEILFGKLAKKGSAIIYFENGELKLKINS